MTVPPVTAPESPLATLPAPAHAPAAGQDAVPSFAPSSSSSSASGILAHEAAHVVQQGHAPSPHAGMY